MKEIYRSFEGTLGIENQSGYVISEVNDFYNIEFLNVFSYSEDNKIQVRKELLPESDFGDLDKISALCMDIENGCADYGRCFYKGKWYGYKTICEIQSRNQDNNWKRYV